MTQCQSFLYHACLSAIVVFKIPVLVKFVVLQRETASYYLRKGNWL